MVEIKFIKNVKKGITFYYLDGLMVGETNGQGLPEKLAFFTTLGTVGHNKSEMTQKEINDLTRIIIGGAIDVHKELGPGLLEGIYEKCLAHLLKQKGFKLAVQQKVPLVFKGLYLDYDLRFDMLINDVIIVEIKSVDALLPIHEAQLLTYLKLLEKPKGILINFNCTNIFREGQKTLVTDLYAKLPKGY